MAISLDDPETDRLAREVAQLTGESVDEAVRKALAERLERERRKAATADLAARLMEIGRHCASLSDDDTRSPDGIIGYDDKGLWR
jgi:antitoxin VapB